MTLSTKTIALSAVLALGALMSTSAHAAVLMTAGGVPALTKDAVPVLVQEADEVEAIAETKVEKTRAQAVYFEFNKTTLSRADKNQLAEMALRLKAEGSQSVAIVGFADRMGNATYNERLALKRAKAVRDYLVAKGIAAKKVEVRSLGKSVPTTNCSDKLSRKEKICCLAKDRRVEIEAR
ncbi:MAG: OmpA family protein [Alphaproteobacteria bacterium]|nr:OmpA family protein [Alphaproteobacteria bacterium]